MAPETVALASQRLANVVAVFLPAGGLVAVHAGWRGEPDPAPALQQLRPDLVLAWPATGPSGAMTMVRPTGALRPGRYGLLEPVDGVPVPPEAFDAVLVPGLLFTQSGDRLGYGGGYYDRFLARVDKEVARIAIGYTWQLVEDLPVADHDIPMTHLALDPDGLSPVQPAGPKSEFSHD